MFRVGGGELVDGRGRSLAALKGILLDEEVERVAFLVGIEVGVGRHGVAFTHH